MRIICCYVQVLDHCSTGPSCTPKSLLDDDGITLSRSLTERLDRLSEREKVNNEAFKSDIPIPANSLTSFFGISNN